MHKILLVNDSCLELTALKSQIECDGQLCVYSSQNVVEAWLLLEKYAFDCILCDLYMPDDSRTAFYQRFKTNQCLAHGPEIMLTAHNQPESLLNAIGSWADELLAKNSDIRIIGAKIRKMLRLNSMQDEFLKLRRVEGKKQIDATYNHDFNNPLTVAIGNLNWLKKSTKTSQLKRINRLHSALESTSGLVKKIRLQTPSH